MEQNASSRARRGHLGARSRDGTRAAGHGSWSGWASSRCRISVAMVQLGCRSEQDSTASGLRAEPRIGGGLALGCADDSNDGGVGLADMCATELFSRWLELVSPLSLFSLSVLL